MSAKPTPPTVAELRAHRAALGLTQHSAAKVLDVTLRTYQGWEQGERPMRAALWRFFQLVCAVDDIL